MNKTGRIPGYAAGGAVGNNKDYSDNYSNKSTDISKYLADFVSISAQIRDNLAGKSTETIGQATPSIVVNNAITVSISDGTVSTQSSTTTTSEDKKNPDKEKQGKEFGVAMNQIISQAIVKSSQNGGYLDSIFKKK